MNQRKKIILAQVLFVFFQGHALIGMQLYDYFTDEFAHSNHQQQLLEYKVYTLLKENPLKKKVNYLAVPWIELHATKKLYDKDFMNSFNLPEKLDGGFTVCTYFDGVRDPETITIFKILKKIGIDTVFTTDAFVNIPSFMGIKVLPLPLHVQDPVSASGTRDIICSFIGFNTYPAVRDYTAQLGLLKNYYVKLRGSAAAFYYAKKHEKVNLKNEYNTVLARSRFSLCPRGFEPGVFRLWESLQAGAIPILISDDWLLPGPRKLWNKAIIRILEEDFRQDPFVVDSVIRKITPEEEAARRKCCLEIYEKYSGKNLVSVIRDYYDGKEDK